ncbi:MAG: KpsF/GutQ family sugar-phosphate isomerase [Planctomycetota bacterium]|nr:KpsF/GutQ family sugar-phosphate isomerase [Planctomycetota bacterium]
MSFRDSLRLFECAFFPRPEVGGGAPLRPLPAAGERSGIDAREHRGSVEPSLGDEQGVIDRGRGILHAEARAIVEAAERLDGAFVRAVHRLEACSGNVVVTGIGKAGLVARKISATLASTGTPSHFLHPTEAMHGDLGVLRGDDLLLTLSQSGETEEITRLIPHVSARGIPIIAITGRAESTLGRAADVVVTSGPVREACELGLAPSTSTSVLLALGDSLALVTSALRAFTAEDFHARHPGGSLGRQLMQVEDLMRSLPQCRTSLPEESVRSVFSRVLPARRTGAVMILDHAGTLAVIFTDSDLARLFERRNDAAIDGPIGDVMTARPTTVAAGTRLRDAVEVLETRRLSELPVVDASGRPVGLLDVVDLVGMVPPELLDLPLQRVA